MKKNQTLPPTYLFVYLLLSFLLHFLFPVVNITNIYRYLGIILVIGGFAINLWADNLFKKVKTTVKPNKNPTKLIINGPFRFSRHPMYLGFVMLLLGVSVVLGSLSSFVGPLFMFITLEKKFIPLEEKQMEKYFGKKYLEYKNRVRRWL